ncbi:carboxypeptidase-like regulatory domain-containing protein [Calycomorphotria hydatis]|nr:carboxypeptidase-like regulatory domain-containing protein [Calycomorphotria hydatis]
MLLLPLMLMAFGCSEEGPKLGTVSGTVTLDGEPLPNAQLMFTPRGEGRPSTASTDENGMYKLAYTAGKKGALTGSHRVSITTAVDQYSDEATGKRVEAVEEKLPAKYHQKSELTAEIQEGSNTIDFSLESQ